MFLKLPKSKQKKVNSPLPPSVLVLYELPDLSSPDPNLQIMSSSNSVIVVPSEIVVALSLLAILSLILNFCFLYQYTHKLVPLKNMANDLEFATKNLKTIVIRPDLLGPDKTRNPSIQFNVITEDFKQKLEPKIPEISEAPEKNTLGMNSEPIEEIQVVPEVAEVPESSGIIEVHEASEKLEEDCSFIRRNEIRINRQNE